MIGSVNVFGGSQSHTYRKVVIVTHKNIIIEADMNTNFEPMIERVIPEKIQIRPINHDISFISFKRGIW